MNASGSSQLQRSEMALEIPLRMYDLVFSTLLVWREESGNLIHLLYTQ